VFLNKAAGVEIYSLGMSNLASVGGGGENARPRVLRLGSYEDICNT